MSRVTQVDFDADVKRGDVWSGSITLSATPNTVTTIVVPITARGFRFYPNSGATLRYNLNVAPAAVTDVATTDQDAVSSDEYAGGWAVAYQWEVRLLEPYNAFSNASRVLQVMSATASATLLFEFF